MLWKHFVDLINIHNQMVLKKGDYPRSSLTSVERQSWGFFEGEETLPVDCSFSLCPNPDSLPYRFQICLDSLYRHGSQFPAINPYTYRETETYGSVSLVEILTDTNFGTRSSSGGIQSEERVIFIGSGFSKVGSLMWLYLRTWTTVFSGRGYW